MMALPGLRQGTGDVFKSLAKLSRNLAGTLCQTKVHHLSHPYILAPTLKPDQKQSAALRRELKSKSFVKP